MEMTLVRECPAEECSYNTDHQCHALAITIGDDANPMCDTFCQTPSKGGDMNATAGVGACKVSCCSHNQSLECNCSEIKMGYNGGEIDCMDFKAR